MNGLKSTACYSTSVNATGHGGCSRGCDELEARRLRGAGELKKRRGGATLLGEKKNDWKEGYLCGHSVCTKNMF
jgi:hypothetical protein